MPGFALTLAGFPLSSIALTMHPSQLVLTNLVKLACIEAELKETSPRSKDYPALGKALEKQRKKIPAPILSHHDRIKAKGRRSVAPVQDWICRACFISIPVGSRQQLTHADDLFICENCGAYIYLPDGTASRPADGLPVESARSKRIATELAKKKSAQKAGKAQKIDAKDDRLAVIKKLSEKMAKSG
jgi:hypothetical protein